MAATEAAGCLAHRCPRPTPPRPPGGSTGCSHRPRARALSFHFLHIIRVFFQHRTWVLESDVTARAVRRGGRCAQGCIGCIFQRRVHRDIATGRQVPDLQA
eukprot:COSAG03_NODE_917_length_5334_cov_28.906399_2_plen_101_part_00